MSKHLRHHAGREEAAEHSVLERRRPVDVEPPPHDLPETPCGRGLQGEGEDEGGGCQRVGMQEDGEGDGGPEEGHDGQREELPGPPRLQPQRPHDLEERGAGAAKGRDAWSNWWWL